MSVVKIAAHINEKLRDFSEKYSIFFGDSVFIQIFVIRCVASFIVVCIEQIPRFDSGIQFINDLQYTLAFVYEWSLCRQINVQPSVLLHTADQVLTKNVAVVL